MRTCVALLALIPLMHGRALAQTGDAQAGKAVWDSPATMCRNCHGAKGEGGMGPDLAGRALTVPQFIRAVRQPWGIMPAFVETQMSDKELSDLVAYFDTLPPNAAPAAWRFTPAPGAPRGQHVGLAMGCAQCHGPTFNVLRQGAGSINGDFEWFKRSVYEHTTEQPKHFALLGQPQARLRMGNFSPVRVPESTLREIWEFISDLGPRPPISAQLSTGVESPNGVTYTLNVLNDGLPGTGLSAEDITVAVVVPGGAAVVTATGPGYEGVRPDAELKGTVAIWRIPRLSPKDRQLFTMTLSRAGTAADNVRGAVRWARPAVKSGPGDAINIAPAPLPTSGAR